MSYGVVVGTAVVLGVVACFSLFVAFAAMSEVRRAQARADHAERIARDTVREIPVSGLRLMALGLTVDEALRMAELCAQAGQTVETIEETIHNGMAGIHVRDAEIYRLTESLGKIRDVFEDRSLTAMQMLNKLNEVIPRKGRS